MIKLLKMFIKDMNLYYQILNKNFDSVEKIEVDMTIIIASKIAMETFEHTQNEEINIIDERLKKLFRKNKINKEMFNNIIVKKKKGDDGDETITLESEIEGFAEYVESLSNEEMENFIDITRGRSFEHRNVLINACISFEIFCSSLLKIIYELPENHYSLKDKTLNYQDLLQIGDIDSAKNYILDRHLEEVFRQRFTEWIKVLSNQLNKKIISENTSLIESIDELYQIRNLFVHNNGVVNSNFKKNTNIENYSIGDDFNLNVKLLRDKMLDLENLSWILFYHFLLRVEKDKVYVFNVLNNMIIDCIDRDTVSIDDILSSFSNDTKIDEQSRLIAKVNYFLHKKMNGRFDEVRNEVEKFEVAHLSKSFQVAKGILLDTEDVVERIQDYVDNLSDREFFAQCDWPLFKASDKKNEIKKIFNNRIEKIFNKRRRENVRKDKKEKQENS